MLVLQPFLQADLGLMMFKPGKTLLSELAKMSQGNRLVVMPLPAELVDVPSGKLHRPIFQERSKPLIEDERLLEFFTKPDVVKRLGGGFYQWLERIPHCQLSDGEYCDKNLTMLDYSVGAIRLCWHHDNQERLTMSDKGRQIAKRNLLLWAHASVVRSLNFPQGHALTLPELGWWSIKNSVYQDLPNSVLNQLVGTKHSDEYFTRFEPAPDTKMESLVKPVIEFIVDPEPPAMFMARPKEIKWRSEKYLKFVRSLPCVVTGRTEGVVAHHLIGHGEGEMGGKTHDLFTMPLTVDEHRRFHDDPKGWEDRNGSQLTHIKNVIGRALGIGALSE
jgi:hypothetical protein